MAQASDGEGNGHKRLVEGIAFVYVARIGIPLMLSALGFLVVGAWNDQKAQLIALTQSITILGERVLTVGAKLETERELRIQSDDQIKERIREIERRERRSDVPQAAPRVE